MAGEGAQPGTHVQPRAEAAGLAVPVRLDAVALREAGMGDLAAVVCQQAALYRDEFRYGPVFEQYLLAGAARFLQDLEPERDRLWVAEAPAPAEGTPLHGCGAVAVQHAPDRPGWAQLRWFVVDPQWRGHGIGRRLMATALAFAEEAGYEGIFLWTVDDLRQAARVYEAAGFHLVHQAEEPCPWAPWGHEQRWERLL